MSAVLEHEHVHTPDDTEQGDLIHTTCCLDTHAICGADVSETPTVEYAAYPNDCIVCENAPCPICGLRADE